jgi:hypothetical protein
VLLTATVEPGEPYDDLDEMYGRMLATFTTLPLASSPLYRYAIDWRRPIQWVMDHSVTAASQPYEGFNLVAASTGTDHVGFHLEHHVAKLNLVADSLSPVDGCGSGNLALGVCRK